MAAPSPFHITDLRKYNEELRRKNLELTNELTALKKAQFSTDVRLKTLEHNLRERDDRIALYIRRLAEYDDIKEQPQASPTAAIDSITVKRARYATTDKDPTTSRSVSAQSSKEVKSLARLASSMRPDSPAFVPSSASTAPSTKTPVNVFLPSLDHSIHAFAPSSGHLARDLNTSSQSSQDYSADLKLSPVMRNMENGRPVLLNAVNKSKRDVGWSQHTLTPLTHLSNGGQRTLLEDCQSTVKGFVEAKSELISQNHGQFDSLTSSNYGTDQTTSTLPRSNSVKSRDNSYSPLHILDASLGQAAYRHQGLQPIRQAVLTPSAHIQPKSITTSLVTDRPCGATSGDEQRTDSWRDPGTTLGNESATKRYLSEESAATEAVGTVDDRPEASKQTFTRILGSALDSESRSLVLKKPSLLVKYPMAGRQPIDLRFSAVLIKLTPPKGKAISFGILDQSSMENAETRLYLVREETGTTGLKLAVKVFPAGKDPLLWSTAGGSPFLAFGVTFKLPGQINTESISLNTYPAAKSSNLPYMIREIESLRDPITGELPADIHRITFTYSQKDIDIVHLNSPDQENYKNYSQWDTETSKLIEFIPLLQESSSKTINITFMNNSENVDSESLIRKWFSSAKQNCEVVKGLWWTDGLGFLWGIEDIDGAKKWRLKLRLPETQDDSKL